MPEAETLSIVFGQFDLLRCRPDYVYTSVAAGKGHVFEDVAPRAIDLDGDGYLEIITVRSSLTKGAQIAIYGADKTEPSGSWGDSPYRLLATTPYIGRRHRWLAPVAWADLDGDGAIEIAYVDRPHLAKILRVWRFEDNTLTEVAALEGITNHRIGEPYISSGIRSCGGLPEMIVADADWRSVLGVRWTTNGFDVRRIGPFEGAPSFETALRC
ncbi:FG-GAP repeat domain-containing protein [Aestuariibius insulae]